MSIIKILMTKKLLLIPILFCFMFSQTENDKILIQENSVYWKEGVDKLVLTDGEVLYGKFIETVNKIIRALPVKTGKII